MVRDDLRLLGLLFELNDLFEMCVELVLVCYSRTEHLHAHLFAIHQCSSWLVDMS